MKKMFIGFLAVAVVALAAVCIWQYQQTQGSAAALIQANTDLASGQQKNADLARQLDDLKEQLADLQAQFEAAQSELETARSDLQVAQQEAEVARKQAEADKATTEQRNAGNGQSSSSGSSGLTGQDILDMFGGGNGGYVHIGEDHTW